jgi:REP element-mobilizing transposase RayT
MPRTARKISFTGYYHVIIRGTNRKVLFYEDKDYEAFLKRIKKYAEEDNVDICAYCLMNNHVHFLLHTDPEDLAQYMKRLGVSYSAYFNKKYESSGHVFQDRYKSEAVEDERYFVTVFRYILNNPVKAGISKAMSYKWSSLNELNNDRDITDFSHIKQFLGKYDVERFMDEEDGDYVMEYNTERNDDEWAKNMFEKILEERGRSTLNLFDKKERKDIIVSLANEGLSKAQIARVTGVSRGVVRGILSK